MAVSLFRAALLSRFYIPSTTLTSKQVTMNTFTLLAVFTLGVLFTCIVSVLYFHHLEIGHQETERNIADLIADRRKLLEKSQKLIMIPDESQLTVFDTDVSVDPALYTYSTNETPQKDNKYGNFMHFNAAL